MTLRHRLPAIFALWPLFAGWGSCLGPIDSDTAVPSVDGLWNVAYDDALSVEASLGGATYTAETGVDGGVITLDHEGVPYTFDLDCANEDIVCPSEVWTDSVTFEARDAENPHQVWMTIPGQRCEGDVVPADPASCGLETPNPDCEDVCDGEVVVENQEAWGVIDEPGANITVLLGGEFRSNGINCALLGISSATAAIVASGSGVAGDWYAEQLTPGTVTAAYAGGCLWADDVDGDDDVEAVALSASLTLRTGFTAERGR
jgi:hypothetical protein